MGTLLGWVPLFLMASPLAWVPRLSSPGQTPHSFLCALGDTRSSLLLILPFSCPSLPVALGCSSADTTWIARLTGGQGKQRLDSISILCEHAPRGLKHVLLLGESDGCCSQCDASGCIEFTKTKRMRKRVRNTLDGVKRSGGG